MDNTLTDPVLDIAVLQALVGDDRDTVTHLLATYIASMRESLRDLEQAMAVRDAKGVRAAAHRMKSPSLSIGAGPLGHLCQALEQAAHADDWSKVDVLYPLFDVKVVDTLRCATARVTAAT